MTEPAKPSPLKRALQVWADEHDITPALFSKTAQYSYNHAYQMLKGALEVSDNTIGRIARYYGAEAAAEILALAEGFEENKKDC